MALTSFWLSSEKELATKHIQAMVGLAGEGRLRDASPAALEFREFLSVVPLAQLSRYATECLGDEKFGDGGRALQDIINEVGRRLGFSVENGLYQGKSGSVGFDGLWSSKDGTSIIVEVKTTDTYSIDLDTLANYRRALIDGGKVGGGSSSILIVVGRAHTGSWKAQVRGSRHAWSATGTTPKMESAPAGAADRRSPQIPLVVFHAAPFQEFEVFLLKRPLSMMLLLPRDVFAHLLALRCTDGERAVALLPRKRTVANFFMPPTRRNRFHVAHHVREADRRAQTDEQMHMVGDATDGFRHAFDIPHHAA
jgi:hypothetical protein